MTQQNAPSVEGKVRLHAEPGVALCAESVARQETKGLLYGGLGVLMFSLTLPASRVAVGSFGPLLVGPGRALLAALFAILALAIRRSPVPRRRQFASLGLISFGTIFGFPYLSAWAMDRLPASHGAVVLALIPLFTAGASTLRNGERPSGRFWLFSLLGALTVIVYTIFTGVGGVHLADVALLFAAILVSFSYAEGGRLAREIGSWQVIAWSVIIALPGVIPLVIFALSKRGDAILLHASPAACWSLLYLAFISQFIGFIAWYRGMEIAGVARVSQMQFIQPFLTLLFSWLLLGERLSLATVIASLIVVGWVIAGKRSAIGRRVS